MCRLLSVTCIGQRWFSGIWAEMLLYCICRVLFNEGDVICPLSIIFLHLFGNPERKTHMCGGKVVAFYDYDLSVHLHCREGSTQSKPAWPDLLTNFKQSVVQSVFMLLQQILHGSVPSLSSVRLVVVGSRRRCPRSMSAFGTGRGRKQNVVILLYDWLACGMMLSCYKVCCCSYNPWDHYFHTAAGLTLKCRALELVISCHLGSTSRNFWRMLETTWWDSCWLLCGFDHSRWTECLLCLFYHLTGRRYAIKCGSALSVF